MGTAVAVPFPPSPVGTGRQRRSSLSLYSGAGAGYSSNLEILPSPSSITRANDFGPPSPDAIALTLQGRTQSASVSGQHNGRPSLDELLKDLDQIPSQHTQQQASHRASSSSLGILSKQDANSLNQQNVSLTGAAKQKCLAVWIAGPGNERGRAGSHLGRLVCCDNIRCTKCDFKVSCFTNRAWDSGVDYLFFRNNFPTESKLAPKMPRQPASCAYCCQCSWVSAQAETKIDFGSELRWVCGGHAV